MIEGFPRSFRSFLSNTRLKKYLKVKRVGMITAVVTKGRKITTQSKIFPVFFSVEQMTTSETFKSRDVHAANCNSPFRRPDPLAAPPGTALPGSHGNEGQLVPIRVHSKLTLSRSGISRNIFYKEFWLEKNRLSLTMENLKNFF